MRRSSVVFIGLSLILISVGVQAIGQPPPNRVVGVVQSISPASGALASFVVRPAPLPGQPPPPPDATILVTAETRYFKGPDPATAAGVKVGVNVDVLLQAPLSGGQGTAVEVHILPPPPPPSVEGIVKSISPATGALQSFVVQPFPPPNQPPPPNVTISVTADTKYFAGGKKVGSDAVKVSVAVKAVLTGPIQSNAGTARAVHLLPPPQAAGIVKSLSPPTGALQSFVLKPFPLPNKPAPPDLTVSVTADTKYFVGKDPAGADAVKVGARAEVALAAPPKGNAATAREVRLLPPPLVTGTVKSLSPATGALESFVLQPPPPPPGKPPRPDATILVNAKTKYFLGKEPATSAAVTVGAKVAVLLKAPLAHDQGTALEVRVRASGGSGQSEGAKIVSACALPTAGGTQIAFALSGAAPVSVVVCNLAGRPIRQVASDLPAAAGTNSLVWNATSDDGLKVPAGRYLVRVTARAANGTSSSVVAPVTITR